MELTLRNPLLQIAIQTAAPAMLALAAKLENKQLISAEEFQQCMRINTHIEVLCSVAGDLEMMDEIVRGTALLKATAERHGYAVEWKELGWYVE